MWPWGHAAVGYLVYAGFTRWRYRSVPQDAAVWTLALGTQFPDVVDKPLAWAGIFPEGRALAHSLLFGVPLCVGVVEFAWRSEGRRAGIAFVIGYFSHLLADSWKALLALRFNRVTYLVWPVLPAPDYPKNSFADHLHALIQNINSVDPAGMLTGRVGGVVFQFALAFLIAGLWILHGMPGLFVRSR